MTIRSLLIIVGGQLKPGQAWGRVFPGTATVYVRSYRAGLRMRRCSGNAGSWRRVVGGGFEV